MVVLNAIQQLNLKNSLMLITATVLLVACSNADKELETQTEEPVVTAPTASPGEDRSVLALSTVTLTGAGTASFDRNIVSYDWAQISGGPVKLVNINATDVQFVAPNVDASYEFELTVTDNADETATGSVVVTAQALQPSNLDVVITPAAGHVVDGVNDNINNPQILSDKAVVGGHLDRISVSDRFDHYQVALTQPQTVNLYLGNATGSAVAVTLRVESDAFLGSVSGNSGVLSIDAPDVGVYDIRLEVSRSDQISYVLTIGDPILPADTVNTFNTDADFVPNELIVGFTDQSNDIAPDVRASNLGMTVKAGGNGQEMLLSLDNTPNNDNVPGGVSTNTLVELGVNDRFVFGNAEQQNKYDTQLAATLLANHPDVAYISLNHRVYPTAAPSDVHYGKQWHLPMIKLPDALDVATADAAVRVAVIDSGMVPHLDVSSTVAGYDFISDPVNANDGDGYDNDATDTAFTADADGLVNSRYHGTQVAGIIAADINGNNTGVAGVAAGVGVMPLRVLGINGGTQYDVLQAVLYAAGLDNATGQTAANPVDVINLSLGWTSDNSNTPDAFVRAHSEGVIIVAAAGNNGANEAFLPAAYDGVVGVSAVGITGDMATYSNFGPNIDVAAPGGSTTSANDINGDGYPDAILSTKPSGRGANAVDLRDSYGYSAGTSMAAAQVSAVAALMKSVNDTLTPADFDTLLSSGDLTQDLGTGGRDDYYGHGLINAHKAVLVAGSTPPADPIVTANPAVIDLGTDRNSVSLNIANTGAAGLTNATVTDDVDWLEVTATSVDENGIGNYSLNVTGARGTAPLLADANPDVAASYSATITVSSANGGTYPIAVTITVAATNAPAATEPNVGDQVVQLRDAQGASVGTEQTLSATGGVYSYSFAGIAPGNYRLTSCSDLDNDQTRFELGESCGAYPTLGSGTNIVVDGSGTPMVLDFNTGFRP